MAASGLSHPLLLSTIFHMDSVTFNGMVIDTKYVFFTWVGLAILLAAGLVLRRKLDVVPGKLQIFFEALVDGLEKFIVGSMGEKGRRFVPLLVSIFIYVLTMNLLGLVPGCDAPTANLNTTVSVALCVFLYYNYVGMRSWGVRYVKHFTGSSKALMPLMFPIEIISHLARPLSMSLRLFGNIFGEETTLVIFFGTFGASIYIACLLGTVPLYFLFLLGKVLQAFILFILSMIYIQGAVEHAH
ncbi:MAG: F0F1 ATP synthase subunit A [Desulfovibrio sp.]|jgi:F-type H+-transporting ATPase subunit a|nr:F0F1 ATP synthase subunit A [Mailhella sp.]